MPGILKAPGSVVGVEVGVDSVDAALASVVDVGIVIGEVGAEAGVAGEVG